MIVNGNTYCRIITPILPYEYQGVEYIESTGTQRIDTGIIRDLYNEFKFEGSFSYSDIYTRQLNGAQGYTYIGVVDGYYQINNKRTEHENVVAIEDEFTPFSVVFDTLNETLKYSINGVTNTKTYVEYEDEPFRAHFYIFSLNDNVLPSSCKIKYWKIYKNNILVRDFIPCYRKSDNEIGMYDTVSKVFYTNQGTGTFLKGNNIVHTIKYKIPVEEKEYIKGHVTDGATSITLKINRVNTSVHVGADGWFVWKKPKDLVITSLRETLFKNVTINELYICLDLSTINDYNRFWAHDGTSTMDNMLIDFSKSKGEIHGDFDHFLYRSHPAPIILPNIGNLLYANSISTFGSRAIPVFGGYIKTNFNFSNLVNLQESNVVNIFSAIAKDGITITFSPTIGAMIDAQMDAGEGAIFDAYMNSDYDFNYTY